MSKLELFLAVTLAAACASHASAAEQKPSCASVELISKPSFKGLVRRSLVRSDEKSTEGASRDVYFRGSVPVYVVAQEFGETGKTATLIRLMNGSTGYYSALVSEYRYSAPIYADHRIVSIRTVSFAVCEGAVVAGVGEDASETKRLAVGTAELLHDVVKQLPKVGK